MPCPPLPSGALIALLDPDHACLWRDAEAIVLSPKTLAVLHYLVTHPDRLVSKDELLDAVWPETAVSDAVVRVAIRALRRALDDPAQTPRFIATVTRRGYRFLASVTEHTGAVSGATEPAMSAALQIPTGSRRTHWLPLPSGRGAPARRRAVAGGGTPPPYRAVL